MTLFEAKDALVSIIRGSSGTVALGLFGPNTRLALPDAEFRAAARTLGARLARIDPDDPPDDPGRPWI